MQLPPLVAQEFTALRERLLNEVLLMYGLASTVSVLLSIERAQRFGWLPLHTGQALICLTLWAMWLGRRHIPYRARVGGLLAVGWIVTVGGLASLGPVANAKAFMVVMALVATLFLRPAQAIAVIAAYVAGFALVGWMAVNGYLTFPADNASEAQRAGVWLTLTWTMTIYGTIIAWMAWRMIDALHASLSRLQALFATANAGMAILRDRLFLNANQHLAEHLQYPRESLIGQSTRMIHLDDDHYRHFGEEVYAQIAQGQPYTLEYPFRRRDGSITWMLISMSPMDLTKETREVAVVAVAIDNLRRARDEALAASRAKSGFLASVTHELRTPLNAIIGFTDLLLDHNPRPDQREHLAIVERSGQTLRRLIDDVLDLTRAESGRFPLNYQPIAPRDLLREALDSVRPSAARKGLELGLQTPSNLPAQLWLPADRLMQILLNLLNNAVKFSARGRVTLNSCFTPKNDALGTFTLEVTDTGPGIAPADQQRIFLPFEQLSNGILNDQGGTGLGLAISRQLAVAMGGSLEVKSAPGKGSRFRLELHEVMTLKPDAEILEEGRSAPAIQVAPAQVLIDRTEVAAPLEPSERQPAPADLPPPHELKPLLEQIDLGQITEATEWAEARQEAYPIFSEWLLRRLRACDLTALRSQLIELTQPDPTRSE